MLTINVLSQLSLSISAQRWGVAGVLAVLGLSLGLIDMAAADPKPHRTIVTKSGVEVAEYRGVRYAKSPEKQNRWKAPVAVTELEILNEWPPICVQDEGNRNWYQAVAEGVGSDASLIPPTPQISEDCLFLNVWRPRNKNSEKSPVMVWIHGGGNVGGWSFEPNYRGHELAARGVVVVSIGYRLNVFGFLAHPDLTAETPYSSSGNYGLLDQLQALRWVQANIEKFGGDPTNVTIFGESAGAGNVGYLIASPLANQLFHKAVIQSGGWPMRQNRTLEQDEADGLAFSEKISLSVAELRDIGALELLKRSQEHYFRGHSALTYDPPVDGWFLPDTPAVRYQHEDLPKRPVLIGSNENEHLMYLPDSTKTDWETALLAVDERQRPAVDAHLKHLSFRQKIDALTTAADYFCDSIATANALMKSASPVYFYRFRKVRPQAELLGAYHGAEIPYVFDTHDDWLPTSNADKTLTEEMISRWTHFAKTGRLDDTDSWPKWSESKKAGLLQDPLLYGALDDSLCSLIAAH